jgi:hypothetical protein
VNLSSSSALPPPFPHSLSLNLLSREMAKNSYSASIHSFCFTLHFSPSDELAGWPRRAPHPNAQWQLLIIISHDPAIIITSSLSIVHRFIRLD